MLKGGEFLFPSANVHESWTPADATGEQLEMRDLAARFVRNEVLDPKTVAAIEAKNFAQARVLLHEMGELGFLGIDMPERFGGLGLGAIDSTLVSEEFGRLGSFACVFGADTGIALWPIRYFGSEYLKDRYIPKVVSGAWVSAYALTEAGSGSDAAAAKATAVPVQDGYLLNGEKMFITNGGFADVYIVFARVPGAGLTAFVVERSWSGVSTGKEEEKLGIHGSSTTPLILADVRVPGCNVLGEPGQGLKIALNTLNLGRFKLGAFNLGAARECFEHAVRHATERKQFGRPIVSFGLIREKLAGMVMRIAAMEAVVYRTAWLLQEALKGVPESDTDATLKAISQYAIECSAVKVFCSESLWWIADECVQVYGGYGFIEDYPAARMLRDARINRLFEGTNEINRLVIMDTLARKARPGKEGQSPELDLRAAITDIRQQVARASFLISQVVKQFRSKFPGERERLNGARRAVLLAIGAVTKRYGKDLAEHQVLIGLASDCVIDLFVLDSMLSAAWWHPREPLVASTGLLFADTMARIDARVRDLFTASLEGAERRKALMLTSFLIPRVPCDRERYIETIVGEVVPT